MIVQQEFPVFISQILERLLPQKNNPNIYVLQGLLPLKIITRTSNPCHSWTTTDVREKNISLKCSIAIWRTIENPVWFFTHWIDSAGKRCVNVPTDILIICKHCLKCSHLKHAFVCYTPNQRLHNNNPFFHCRITMVTGGNYKYVCTLNTYVHWTFTLILLDTIFFSYSFILLELILFY